MLRRLAPSRASSSSAAASALLLRPSTLLQATSSSAPRRLFHHQQHHQQHRGRGAFRYRVESTPIARVAASAQEHPRQIVERTWTLRDPSSTMTATVSTGHRGLEKLQVAAPGLTRIRVRPELREALGPGAVARIRVTSSAEELLEGIEVLARAPHRTRVHFVPPPNAPAGRRRSRGHRDRADVLPGSLVTEIEVLEPQCLRNVAVLSPGADVVIHDGVLPTLSAIDTDAAAQDRARPIPRRVKLLAAADGAKLLVHAPDAALTLQSLQVGAARGGAVQLTTRALDVAAGLELGIAGGGPDGRILLDTGSLRARDTTLAVVGDGDVEVRVREDLSVDDLEAFVAGKGCIRLRHSPASTTLSATEKEEADSGEKREKPGGRGRVGWSQSMRVVGEGHIDTGDVPFDETKLAVVGRGELRIQPGAYLGVTSAGPASVDCVGAPVPSSLDLRGYPSPSFRELSLDDHHKERDQHSPMQPPFEPPTIDGAYDENATLRIPRRGFWERLCGRYQRRVEDWNDDDHDCWGWARRHHGQRGSHRRHHHYADGRHDQGYERSAGGKHD